jgi:RNA polymerase-binding protein DksA
MAGGEDNFELDHFRPKLALSGLRMFGHAPSVASCRSSRASTRVPGDGDPRGDHKANADAEAELQIRLHHTDSRLLRAIEEALARIERDTYGVCETCRQPIASARLKAVPWVRHCRHCKESEHA